MFLEVIMKILLVEDDPILGLVFEECLKDLGCEVIVANDGLSAIDAFMPDEVFDPTFTAIISDCRMSPGKSGIWLLQYLNRSRIELPFLLHSSGTTFTENGFDFPLKEITDVFTFASYHPKEENLGYIATFIDARR